MRKVFEKKEFRNCTICGGRAIGCKVCKGLGKVLEKHYYFFYEKDGKKYCIDGDTLK